MRTYSGGMRRRLDLAVSLIGRPDVLFLDEPTTGLDPRHRNEVWDQVRGLAADGVTVLLTTQYLEEADQLADDLVVLDRGRVIAGGTPASLKAEVGGQALHVRPLRGADVPRAVALVARAHARAGAGRPTRPASSSCPRSIPPCSAASPTGSTPPASPSPRSGCACPSLDDVFLTLTGHTAEPTGGRMTTLATGPARVPHPPRAPARHAARPSVRHAATLAWRGITKTIHSTEALLDVTLQPVIFLLLFVYVFGGAISGSTGRLPAARAARRARADDRVRLGGHRRRAGRGPADRHLRPLPQPAHRAQRPARRRDRSPTSSAT